MGTFWTTKHVNTEAELKQIKEHLISSVIRRIPRGDSIKFCADNRMFILRDIATKIRDSGNININSLSYELIDNKSVAVELFVSAVDGSTVPHANLKAIQEFLTNVSAAT